MVYGIIELINFAHGDMFMVGAFVSLSFLDRSWASAAPIDDIPRPDRRSWSRPSPSRWSSWALVGVVIERFAYRPLRNAPRLAPLITAIGVSFILQNIVQLRLRPVPDELAPDLPRRPGSSRSATSTIPVLSIFIIAVAVGLMIALQLFIGRTRLGRAMRSTAADRDAAALMGVNINRTIAITFLIGSALAGAAGVVNGLQYGVARFDDGFQAGLKAFTAAVLGGIGNTVGAALGGFIIGFIEVGATAMGYTPLGPGRSCSASSSSSSSSARPASSASSWVSGHERRARISRPRGRRAAPSGRARETALAPPLVDASSSAWRSWARVLPLLAYIPPFTLAQPSNAWIDGFTNAGVFVLLALGLNLVVGVAGLLDLGYAAFFAIGAYTYAYVASPFGNSIIGIPIVETLGGDGAGYLFWPMLIVGALVAATFGILLGAPTLRLRGDYLAIVTLGFGEIVPIVFLNSDAVTNGTNGIGGLSGPRLPIIGAFSADQPVALLRHDAGRSSPSS